MPDEEECIANVESITPVALWFGVLIAIGVWISWLPQQVQFLRSKSTFGVSYWWILLTQAANWAPFIIGLYTNWDLFRCCSYLDFWDCQKTLVTMWQLGISTFSVTCIFILYVMYYDPIGPTVIKYLRENPLEEVHISDKVRLNAANYKDVTRKAKFIKFILSVGFMVLVFVSIVIGYFIMYVTDPQSSELKVYTIFLSVIGVLSVVVQFTPQIYITYKLKTSGNLSLVMLIIQTPGTWVWLFYMVVVDPQDWTVWLSSFVAGSQVSVLLAQVIYYDFCFNRKKKGVSINDEDSSYGVIEPLVMENDKY